MHYETKTFMDGDGNLVEYKVKKNSVKNNLFTKQVDPLMAKMLRMGKLEKTQGGMQSEKYHL